MSGNPPRDISMSHQAIDTLRITAFLALLLTALYCARGIGIFMRAPFFTYSRAGFLTSAAFIAVYALLYVRSLSMLVTLIE